MTQHGHVPTDANEQYHTSYERTQRRTDGANFDYDGHSCASYRGIWPNHVSDIEDLTMLSGLSDPVDSEQTNDE